MSDVVKRRKTCRLCNGSNFEMILQWAPTPIADAYVPLEKKDEIQDSYPLDLFNCLDCGFSQILDIIDPSVLYRDYIYVTTSSLGLANHFEGYAKSIVSKLAPSENSMIVDIGSNDGTLLRAFKNHNMQVLGVEPASEIASEATRSGVKTLPEFFGKRLSESIVDEFGKAKIITMNNLFANIDDLEDTVRGVANLLDKDGVFVFESFYFVDYIENKVFDFMYHEHLSYFTIDPLNTFFKRLGMEIFDIERVPTKGGSVRVFVQLAEGSREVSPTVANLLDYEKKIEINQPSELFKTYKSKIEGQKNNLVTYLKELKSQGKVIAGFGASATTTTMIYHFGITDLISFIVDDNIAKQNTLTPGCHIPVVPSSELYKRKPDSVVMIAWRYASPIIENHQRYLDEGGEFVVPLPEFKIIK